MDAEELAIKRGQYRLEKWKLLLSGLTPVILGMLTYVVNNAIQERGALLKREEQVLAEKQRVYGEMGKKLNIIYCYVKDVGDYRSYTPGSIVEMKRECDRQFYTYRPYWNQQTERRYADFMNAAFQTYNGAGIPARINTSKAEKVAAYDFDKLTWNTSWDTYFTERADPDITRKYNDLVSSLLEDTVRAGVRRVEN